MLAFFETIVPKEILLDEANDFDLRELRKALDRLVKNKLVLTETDALQELNEKSGKMTDIIYYSLHGFVRETTRRVLSKFEEENSTILEKIAERMKNETDAVWEKKLFEKMLALVECQVKIETYLVSNLKKSDREFNLDSAEFNKALALQKSAFSLNHRLSHKEISERTKGSEAIYLRYIEKYPNNADAYNNLGNLLAEQDGRLADAERAFNKAIELNPNFAEAYYNLGNLLDKQKERFPDSEKAYNKAIELNPNKVEAYNNLGALLASDENRRDEAEVNFNNAINLNLNHTSAYYNLGVLLAKDEKRRDKAEANFKKAIELKPHYANTYYNLACLNSLMKKLDEGLGYLKQAVELDAKFKSVSKKDSDFDWLRDDERFKMIVGGDDE